VVKVYSVVLVVGILGLLAIILGGALADNGGRHERGPGERFGLLGKTVVGAALGFGMGGICAEFSPLGLTWQTTLTVAVAAAGLSVLWVRHAVRHSEAG
jgi:hypothetical protein